jgi:hypothetical protein
LLHGLAASVELGSAIARTNRGAPNATIALATSTAATRAKRPRFLVPLFKLITADAALKSMASA